MMNGTSPPVETATRLSPHRAVITSFSSPATTSTTASSSTTMPPSASSFDAVQTPYEEGQWILCLASSNINNNNNGETVRAGGYVSCALSDRSIRTYDQETLRLVHTVQEAHSKPITDLCHAAPFMGDSGGGNDEHFLVSSGKDGIVRVFDLRRGNATGSSLSSSLLTRPIMEMHLPRFEEALSVAIGYNGSLAAVGGGKGSIHFFDLRRSSQLTNNSNNNIGMASSSSSSLLGSYVDAHTDEVTKVRFQPSPFHASSNTTTTTTPLLVSASEDGLVCVHDTSQPSEEMALKSVMNINAPLRDVGFFGPNMEGIYCLTGSETFSVWHHESAQRISDYYDLNIRTHLSSCAGFPIDYLVGCEWDDINQTLSLVTGNNVGDGAIFHVEAGGTMKFTHALTGGHRGCIRAFVTNVSSLRSTAASASSAAAAVPLSFNPKMIITGGEDARLCEWKLTNGLLSRKPQRRGLSSLPSSSSTTTTTTTRRNTAAVTTTTTIGLGQASTMSSSSGILEQPSFMTEGGGPARRRIRKKPTVAPY